MRFRLNLFSTKRIAQAQWSLVNILSQALGNVQENGDVCRHLQEILHRIKFQANSPRQWAELFTQALVEIVTDLQTQAAVAYQAADDARQKSNSLQQECNSLRSTAQRDANRRLDQIFALSGERDQAYAKVSHLINQVHTLEKSLARAQQPHLDKIECLRKEISDLRRITAEQQLQLSARDA